MRRRTVGSWFTWTAAWLSLSGCAGISRVATLPDEAGVPARYHASIDDVADVVPLALAAAGQEEVERSRPDSSTLILFGSRGPGFWDAGLFGNYGFVSRTRITNRGAGGSDVRVVTRPRGLLRSGSSVSSSLRVVGEIDRLLGPDEIAFGPGDRVRGFSVAGVRSEGTLEESGLDGLVLMDEDEGAERVPLESLTQVEVHRGSYGYGDWGAGLGLGIGFGVAIQVCYDSFSSFCDSPASLSLAAAGGLVGWLIGRSIRRSTWSRAGS